MASPDSLFAMGQYGMHDSYNTAYPEGALGTYLTPNQRATYFHNSHSSQDGSDHSGSFVSPASMHAFLPDSNPSLAPHHDRLSSLSSIEQDQLFDGLFELVHPPSQSPERGFAANTTLVNVALEPSPTVAPEYIQTSRSISPRELLPKDEPEPISPAVQSHPLASVQQPSMSIPSDDTPDQYRPTDITCAALRLISCDELRTNSPIPHKLLLPFLQKIPYASLSNKGLGSRDGPMAYRCLWTNCEYAPLKRRDHALDHVAAHVGSKPYKCSDCGLRFLRRADHKRHIDSRSHVKGKNNRKKLLSIEVCSLALLPWPTFLRPLLLRSGVFEWAYRGCSDILGRVLKMKTMEPV